ncbi:hypothetical protein Tco_0889806, partial [Tanacetum coccineum]
MMIFMVGDFFSVATTRTGTTDSTATIVPEEEQLLDGEIFRLGSQTYEGEGKALDWEVIMSIDDIFMDFAIEFTENMYWNDVYRNDWVTNNVSRNNHKRKSCHVTKKTLSIVIRCYPERKSLEYEVIMSTDDIVMEFATEFTEIMYWNYVYRNERVVNNVAKEQPSKKILLCDKEDTIDLDPVLSRILFLSSHSLVYTKVEVKTL